MIAALALLARPVSTAKGSGSETAAASNLPSASFQDALDAVARVDAQHGSDQQSKGKPDHRERTTAQIAAQAQPLTHQPSASPLAVVLNVPPPPSPEPIQRASQPGQFDLTASSAIESQDNHPLALQGAAPQAATLPQAAGLQRSAVLPGEQDSLPAIPNMVAKADTEIASNVPSTGNRPPADNEATSKPVAASVQSTTAADSGAASKASTAHPIAAPFMPLLSSDSFQECLAQRPLATPTSLQPASVQPVSMQSASVQPQSAESIQTSPPSTSVPAVALSADTLGSAVAFSSQMALFSDPFVGRIDSAEKAPVVTSVPDGADQNASHLADAGEKSLGAAQGQPQHDQANPAVHHSDSGNASQDSSAQQQPGGASPVLAATKAAPDAAAVAHFNVHAFGSSAPNAPLGPAVANQGLATDRQAAAQPLPAAMQPPMAVNTAQLIHTIQDSQMRVGIHSAEFGNISISTSASRDAVSAQISLDHPELARAIANNIPQIRETLGPNQNLDIRIAMNAQSGSTLNYNSGGSGSNQHDAWQPSGTTRAGPQPSSSIQNHAPSVEPGVLYYSNGDTSRLDVRI